MTDVDRENVQSAATAMAQAAFLLICILDSPLLKPTDKIHFQYKKQLSKPCKPSENFLPSLSLKSNIRINKISIVNDKNNFI